MKVYEYNGALYANKDTAVCMATDAIKTLLGKSGFDEAYLKVIHARNGDVFVSYDSASGLRLSGQINEREVE